MGLIDPRVITGLIQSDGAFSVSIKKSPSTLGFVLRPQLTISMMLTSLNLLKAVHQYFGVGTLSVTDKYVQFQVSGFLDLWHVIIPHFITYPLFGNKHLVFVKFVTIMTLLFPFHNKDKPTIILMKVLVLMINMNTGSSSNSPSQWLATLNIVPDYNVTLMTDYLSPLLFVTPHFLVGLIEGDGSFYFSVRSDTGQVRFGFNITTNMMELDLMHAVRAYLGFGRVTLQSTWCRFETESVKHLLAAMVPLVDGIPMLGSKNDKFLAFRKAIMMFKNKDHLTAEGLDTIKSLLKSP